ncbi:hypothetical protein PRIPAC_79944 [Pristionchus pacificus]|uniref:G protein-coupled receptor n=1 Tax=Pristionchus pacificus TaxID=54126 RepID=A0A2A6CP33_PRIPA|nr:hypothetical protein PRIPAC_79944 [Pristionchus pacificus]|eukprot:PDM79837.1 G protein-coupled receptor [Pristionchus pacificus]
MSRLIFAYTVPVICNAKTWYFMSFNEPDQELRNEMIRSITALHGTDSRSYHAYSARIIADQGIDLLAMILYDVLRSYVICYGIFTWCAIQIRFRLRSYGSTASRKMEKMQRRFYSSQIIQMLLPIVLTAVPICIALIAALGGLNLANVSNSPWLMPTATATLFLIFVAKSSAKSTVRTPNVSTTKVEHLKPEDMAKIAMRLRKSSFNPDDGVVVRQCS